MSARRRTTPVPPSGRFDALVDMGNPMKGVIIFPFLQRRVEGRALRAMAPASSLELCRTVAEAVVPRRWPRDVRCQKLGMFDFLDCLDRCVEMFTDSCKACGIAACRVRGAPNSVNSRTHVAWP
jgi:hypothetical protein